MACCLLLLSSTLTAGTTNTKPAAKGDKTGSVKTMVISGKDITEKERDPLMKSLNRDRTSTYGLRRGTIVFFVSLPVTLWLSWTLLEFMIRKTHDDNNPNKEFQKPHYIYMFSSSIATSLYIAHQDSKRYGIEPDSGPPEKKVTIPILGLRF